jgi:DNA-directed RNA polymerase subunit RPC12/RpoP
VCEAPTVRCVDCGGLYCRSHVTYRVGAELPRCPECSARDLMKETETVSPRKKTSPAPQDPPAADAAAAVVEAPRTKIVHRKRQLRCVLTPDERYAKAEELAKAIQDLEAEERRQTEVKSQLKAEIGAIQALQSRLASIVASGCEYRDVVVQDLHDYVAVTVTTVRTDTGEQINVRTMTDDERQMPLPGADDVDDGHDDEGDPYDDQED